ncbi:MAG: alpha/beta hydrolase [bacterium]|nr:MAG: alpha/beta hydrolase [bacterium]
MIRRSTLTMLFFLLLGLALVGCTSTKRGEAVSSDGVAIQYEVSGKGEPVLVFVHGWCCDRGYWRYQLSRFARDHKVVALDLAGHGGSGANRTDWTVESFGGDVAAVVELLDLEKVILIGHSMGGQVNLEAARRLPGRIIGLVGVDTYQDFEAEFPRERRDQFIESFKVDFVRRTENFVRGMFVPRSDSALVEWVVRDMASAPPDVGIGAMAEFLAYRSIGTLAELNLPIRCINSDKYPVNVEAGRRHALSFEVTLMHGLGHFVMLEDPERFNALLTGVIEGLKTKDK